MQNNYSLKFTPLAYEDLDQIYSYILCNLSAEIAANKLMDKIENAINQLKAFPKIGSYIHEDILRIKGYRKLVVNNFLVLYLVNEELKQVEIMRIVYGAKDYEMLL
jgi:toxin ParE1/3/4